MIELNGFYYQNDNNNESIPVLAQFDGRLLHIWHVSDPFYRVRTSKKFRICVSKNGSCERIRFQDGARLETDNLEILEQLNTIAPFSTQAGRSNGIRLRPGPVCLTLFILFMLSAIGISVCTM